ncbi:MAG: hypothetical protein LBI92_00265 [Azoarcus sp.]|jgi:hypothetical protein|nr:hypothetical protein [Azoarcus sp.]
MKARRFLFPLLAALTLDAASAAPPATLSGRLFFSAAERREMEAPPKPAPKMLTFAAAAPRRYDGALWRDGRIVALWFDGTETRPARVPAIRLHGDRPATAHGGRSEPLLPGASWPPAARGTRP